MVSEVNDDFLDEFNEDKSLEQTELDIIFNHATLFVRKRVNQIAKENLLYLYARFKYANEGPCTVERPGGLFNFEAKTKWDSWTSLDYSMGKEKAQEEYINKLDTLFPKWRDGLNITNDNKEKSLLSNEFSKADEKGTFGVRMSVMAQQDTLNDSDKTCFDYCKEGSLDKLKAYLDKYKSSNTDVINQLDDNQMTLLMWSCDRGHLEITDYLIQHGADVNKQDCDGQTCLHYAVSCEHINIIKLLINSNKLNLDLEDNDGLKAINSTENKDIIKILNRK